MFRKESFGEFYDFFEPSYITYSEFATLVDEDTFYKVVAIFLAVSKNKARIKISQDFRFVYNSNGVSETDAALNILGLYKNVISPEEAEQLDENMKEIDVKGAIAYTKEEFREIFVSFKTYITTKT